MKLAVITDSSVYLPQDFRPSKSLFILDIEITIEGETYIEGKNLTLDEFYRKMAASAELPKTSQPSLAELSDLLTRLEKDGYTHVIGLFLSGGISGFHQNIQYLTEEYDNLTIAFPDTKITSSPMGWMVMETLRWGKEGLSFEQILANLEVMIEKTNAFIMVDDLNHLVKGGRLSNGSALLGNLLSIKPILYFTDGRIEVFEKVRTEKKAVKRLIDILGDVTADGDYMTYIIHANASKKAEALQKRLMEDGYTENLAIVPFNGVIATHLGEGAIALGAVPIVKGEEK
ncbi:DegV family protein [Streptococcus caviae]|uniref:DegV family protein n=1 Tax=Streptococcus sp. 'caviae' TaxID=1915004 RepID=UPI00094BBDEA|nr:DegV family protein [Streptococcus sp. 'caviae']OLN83853.1 EDD domain protein [Streptococcus sp. 'caviae']